MAVIDETGDEWIVVPTPIVVPVGEPDASPTSAPGVPAEPLPVGGEPT